MSAGGSAPSPLPLTARIREVGPRDGFQNEPEVIPTETKVQAHRGAGPDRAHAVWRSRASSAPT